VKISLALILIKLKLYNISIMQNKKNDKLTEILNKFLNSVNLLLEVLNILLVPMIISIIN
jgi:hypothetical protein